MKILIFTEHGDISSAHVAVALTKRGHDVKVLFPLEITTGATWSYDVSAGVLAISRPNGQIVRITYSEVDVIWHRLFDYKFQLSSIADIHDRAVAEGEMASFISHIRGISRDNIFSINAPASFTRARNKLEQKRIAILFGMRIPNTLISNDFQAIKQFCDQNLGLVHKLFGQHHWRNFDDENRTFFSLNCSRYLPSLEDFTDADFCNSPAIYEQRIVKSCEVRVTVMGKAAFAVLQTPIDPDAIEVIDWRIEKKKFFYDQTSLPDEVYQFCLNVLSEFGLVFGCFDFAIDEHGKYIFLEVNPGGQFLKTKSGASGTLDLLGPFIRFIESKDASFVMDPDLLSDSVKVSDIPSSELAAYSELVIPNSKPNVFCEKVSIYLDDK